MPTVAPAARRPGRRGRARRTGTAGGDHRRRHHRRHHRAARRPVAARRPAAAPRPGATGGGSGETAATAAATAARRARATTPRAAATRAPAATASRTAPGVTDSEITDRQRLRHLRPGARPLRVQPGRGQGLRRLLQLHQRHLRAQAQAGHLRQPHRRRRGPAGLRQGLRRGVRDGRLDVGLRLRRRRAPRRAAGCPTSARPRSPGTATPAAPASAPSRSTPASGENAVADFVKKNYPDAAPARRLSSTSTPVPRAENGPRPGPGDDQAGACTSTSCRASTSRSSTTRRTSSSSRTRASKVVFWVGAYQQSVRLAQAMQQQGYKPDALPA